MSKDPSKMPEYPGQAVDSKPSAKKRFYDEGASFKQFLWNPATKEVLGRDARSWGKITVFYIVFYGFLACFFAILMTVFYHTLDDKRPKYTSEGGESVLNSPGLSMRPQFRGNQKQYYLMEYNPRKEESYKNFADDIDAFIKAYEDVRGAVIRQDCSNAAVGNGRGDCDFDLSTLGMDKTPLWGYDTASPTVILKLNKVFDWKAKTYKRNAASLPVELKNYINENMNEADETEIIWLWCTSKDGVTFTYSPRPGFPAYYFPFIDQEGFLSPLVAVTIKDLPEKKVRVVCTAYAKNLKYTSEHNEDLKETSIHFTFLREKDNSEGN